MQRINRAVWHQISDYQISINNCLITERERETERDRQTDRDRQRQTETERTKEITENEKLR